MEGLTKQQKAIGGILALVAIIGWVVAVVQIQGAGDLQARLTTAEADLAKAQGEAAKSAEALAASKKELETLRSASGELEKVNGLIEAGKSELTELAPRLESGRDELDDLLQQLGDAQEKLATLQSQAEVYERLSAEGPFEFQTTTQVNVRTEPSTSSDVLVTLPAGSSVEVFEVVEDGEWFKIGGVGFIFHEFVTKKEEAAQQ